MNFRKGIFALALGSLGLTGIASAQITCTTASATSGTAFVRVEGTTELVPSMTIGGCTQGATPTTATITVTTSAGVTNANVSGESFTDATASFFGAPAVNGTLSGNTLTFTASGTNLVAPSGTTPGTTDAIVISGVRVNAASVPLNTSITETAAAGQNVILTPPAATATPIAYTQPGFGTSAFQGFTNVAICSPSATSGVVPLGQAVISSGYNGSFTPEGTGSDLFISVTFGNLAAGANYYVPVSITSGVLGVTSATLVSGNTSTTAVSGTNIGPSSAQVSGVAQLTLANGSATALYHLAGASTSSVAAFIVPLYAVVTGGATVGATASPTVIATFTGNGSGPYDQFSTTQKEQSASASATASALTGLPWPTITIGTGPAALPGGGELTSCATTLLFPYVLNAGGYDTGIALTNASAGTSLAQDGACSVQFYGSSAPSSAYTTDTITAGSVAAFTVSSQASGFVGYAIATCNFQDAHGFAFITDGFGQPGRGLSQGYLAIVTSAGGTTLPFQIF